MMRLRCVQLTTLASANNARLRQQPRHMNRTPRTTPALPACQPPPLEPSNKGGVARAKPLAQPQPNPLFDFWIAGELVRPQHLSSGHDPERSSTPTHMAEIDGPSQQHPPLRHRGRRKSTRVAESSLFEGPRRSCSRRDCPGWHTAAPPSHAAHAPASSRPNPEAPGLSLPRLATGISE